MFTEWSGDLTDATTPGALTVNDQVYVTGNFVQPGRLIRSGVVDAANYQGQVVSPGEILAIFGLQFGSSPQLAGLQVAANTVTNNLAQTRVLFHGQPAPLVYVSGNQISAIVPYAVAGKTTTRLAIEYQGRVGNAVNLPVFHVGFVGFRPSCGVQSEQLGEWREQSGGARERDSVVRHRRGRDHSGRFGWTDY